MDLVELPFAAEAQNFLTLCAQQQIHLKDGCFHVGASYLGAAPYDFYWMTTGKRINYGLRYAPGEPNNVNGVEKFLSLSKKPQGFLFNDIDYNYTKWNFFCQHITNSTNLP